MPLADERDTVERASPYAFYHEVLGATSEEFYQGQLLVLNLTTGRVQGGATGTDSNFQACGRCEVRKSVGASEDALIRFKSGIFRWLNEGSFTAANVGDICYVADDDAVNATDTNAIAGRIYEATSAYCDVLTMWPLPQLAPIGPTSDAP